MRLCAHPQAHVFKSGNAKKTQKQTTKKPKQNTESQITGTHNHKTGIPIKSNKGFMVSEADINNPIHNNSLKVNSNLVTMTQIKHSFDSI